SSPFATPRSLLRDASGATVLARETALVDGAVSQQLHSWFELCRTCRLPSMEKRAAPEPSRTDSNLQLERRGPKRRARRRAGLRLWFELRFAAHRPHDAGGDVALHEGVLEDGPLVAQRGVERAEVAPFTDVAHGARAVVGGDAAEDLEPRLGGPLRVLV